MIRIYLLMLTLAVRITATASRKRDERGEGAVMAFAKGLVANLGSND